ncbi:MAG: peptidoglycan DD-metalloendopeptidase family protein [Cyanobacteria bacterium P01_H01_bin.162]
MVFDGVISMQPEQLSSEIKTSPSLVLSKQVRLLSSLGAVSLALALGMLPAQAEVEAEVEAPTAVEVVPSMAPVETSAESLLEPQVPVSPAPEPEIVFEQAPAQSSPASEPAESAASSEELPPAETFNNVFIDPTDYSLGATPSPDTPSLIFSDRSTGCQFRLQQGQTAPTSACGSAAQAAAASGSNYDAGADGSGFNLGPIGIGSNGVTVGNTTVISREYFNERLSTLNLLRRGAEEFVFPIAMPSPITSLFGWRIHPISGDRRFHTGTDLGAPEGTPVVATKDGEVQVADYLGGYGLTVILHHENGSLETRYAHLSRLLVRPGETVKQGDVVGLIGSTGNSTGPHLHFELRELTAQGWVLINPDELMNYTMANLVDVLNHPLHALGLADGEKDGSKLEGAKNLPYRPAQPNAN